MSKTGKNRYSGSKNVLVLRASGSKQEPEANAAALSKAIFSDDEVSLKSGYEAISFGQLKLSKATGKKVVDGVLEVKLDIDTDKKDFRILGDAILKAAEGKLEITQIENKYDFIMICLPSGTTLGSGGAGDHGTQIIKTVSFFNDTWSTNPKVQMHEIGHNLGFDESGTKTTIQGDKSCIMSSTSKTRGPKLCFNGVKCYLTGWYKNETIDFFPKLKTSKQWDGKLVGVTDSDKANKDHIVVAEIKTEATSDFKYYILFNRKDGINSDVEFEADKIMITKGFISQLGHFEKKGSMHMAALAVNEEYSIRDYKNSGVALTIKYLKFVKDEKPPYAHVGVYLGNEQPDFGSPTGGKKSRAFKRRG